MFSDDQAQKSCKQCCNEKEKQLTVNVVAMQIKGRIPQIKYNYTEEENCQKFLLATTLESIFYSATSRK